MSTDSGEHHNSFLKTGEAPTEVSTCVAWIGTCGSPEPGIGRSEIAKVKRRIPQEEIDDFLALIILPSWCRL